MNHTNLPDALPTAPLLLPEALSVGIPEIDEQHRHLFELLELIKSHCFDHGRLPDDEAELLLRALAEHFSTEERVAYDLGKTRAQPMSREIAEHIAMHHRIYHGIQKGITEVRQGGKNVFSLLRYIEYWFERHIIDEDQPMLLGAMQPEGEALALT